MLQDMRIAWEEPFGPVIPVIRVKTIDDAIDHCNSNNLALQVSTDCVRICICLYLFLPSSSRSEQGCFTSSDLLHMYLALVGTCFGYYHHCCICILTMGSAFLAELNVADFHYHAATYHVCYHPCGYIRSSQPNSVILDARVCTNSLQAT